MCYKVLTAISLVVFFLKKGKINLKSFALRKKRVQTLTGIIRPFKKVAKEFFAK